MSKTKTRYFSLTEEEREALKQKPRNYMKKYRAENPEKTRLHNKLSARKIREQPGYNKKFSKYFKKWYGNLLNKRTHLYRTHVGTLKNTLLKLDSRTHTRAWNPDSIEIYENLKSVGWHENLNKKMCVNHKLSIRRILEFSIDTPKVIVYSAYNLEIITRVENNSAGKRTITDESVKIARRLEKDFPKFLKGLAKHIQRKIGKVQ